MDDQAVRSRARCRRATPRCDERARSRGPRGRVRSGRVSETPAHPQRTFRGADQVRRNWEQIFAGVPDLRADLLDAVVDGDTVWSEWDWQRHAPRWIGAPDARGHDPAGLRDDRAVVGPLLHGARRRGRSRRPAKPCAGSSAGDGVDARRRCSDDPRGGRDRACSAARSSRCSRTTANRSASSRAAAGRADSWRCRASRSSIGDVRDSRRRRPRDGRARGRSSRRSTASAATGRSA